MSFIVILLSGILTPLMGQISEQPVSVYASFSGNLEQVQNGTSFYIDESTGTFDIDIPTCSGGGTANIEGAYLVWMARNWSAQGVATFDLDVVVDFNGSGNTTITADDDFTSIDATNNRYFNTGIADITALVQANYSSGQNTVNITGWDVPTGNPSWAQKFGIGIQIIYECPEYEDRNVSIYVGNDFFYEGEVGTFGDYSSEVCYTFTESSSPRNATVKGFLGGQANATAPFRGNQLWYLTGTGTAPTEGGAQPTIDGVVVNDPGAIQLGAPNSIWSSTMGAEWDSINLDLVIPPGETYICIQGYSKESDGSAFGVSGNIVSPFFSIQNVSTSACADPNCAPLPTATVCSDGSDSVTLTCDGGLTGITWYNGDGDVVGMDCDLTLNNTDIQTGAVDDVMCFYYEATDANNCSGSSCCPVMVSVVSCFVCPVITNATADIETCDGEVVAELRVETDAVTPDQIEFVYFTTPQSAEAMYTGGTSLGTETAAVGEASIINVSFPSVGTYYVYAILSPTPSVATCRPFEEIEVIVNALPDATLMVSDPIVCEEAEIEIEVMNTEIGVQYQLQNVADNSTVGAPTPGNGSTIVLSVPATLSPGDYVYNVEAMNSMTACLILLADQAMVTINECDYPLDPEPRRCSGFSPCHFIDTNISLGVNLSGDSSSAATDDNDGVSFPNDIQPGGLIQATVSITNNTGNEAYLNGWIDWNGDGDFDDVNEQVANASYASASFSGFFTTQIAINIPADAQQDTGLSSFWRVSTDSVNIASACGESASCAVDGEIEVYEITVTCKPDVCLPTVIETNRSN